MLQRVTSHCPGGHELAKNATERTKKISPSEVLDVMQVGWCDVCIEPFAQDEERYSCSTCFYDCCWKCHDEGREAYYFCLEFAEGPLSHEPIYGTIDVLKSKLDEDDLKLDEPVASKAILTFDCDLYDLTFGCDAEEIRQIRRTSSVTFDRATGQMKSFALAYLNPNPDKDLKIWGRSVTQFSVNLAYDAVPESVKASGSTWAGCTIIAGEERLPDMFASVTFHRFGLIQVPGFGMPEDKQGRTLKLLREIARDKRGIINPMRKQHLASSSMSMSSGCLPPFLLSKLSASSRQQAATTTTGGGVPADNLAEKKRAAERNNKIIEQLELTQPDIKYKESAQSGKVNHRDLMYTSRLSLLAYLIDRVPYGQFYSAEREKYLLDPVWVNFIEHIEQNEGRELLRQWLGMSKQKQRKLEDHAHEAFLAKFIASFFDTDSTSPEYGMSRALNAEPNGPLRMMGLEYAPIHPEDASRQGVIKMGSTEMFVAVSSNLKEAGGDICFVFQGTNDLKDLAINFNGLTTPFEPMVDITNAGRLACLQGRVIADGDESAQGNSRRVHLGFYNAFLRFRDQLDRFLRETLSSVPKDKNVRIVVTGHSLGGALAMICMGWLLQLFDEKYESKSAKHEPIRGELTGEASDRLRILCVTYGAPKVGNADYVQWLDEHRFVQRVSSGETVRAKILRLIDVMDPIVTLPPSSGGFAYRHTARKGATVSHSGNMLFISREAADRYDDTTRGLGVIARQGAGAGQFHDLFLYMHKCLHFAWVFNNVAGDSKQDWDEDPLQRAFGANDYRYDSFVQSDEFRTKF